MKKQKIKYRVYCNYCMTAEEQEDCFEEGWQLAGETYAVSEAKAINNVRYNMIGCISQYKPLANSAHWETWYKWKAIPVEERKSLRELLHG